MRVSGPEPEFKRLVQDRTTVRTEDSILADLIEPSLETHFGNVFVDLIVTGCIVLVSPGEKVIVEVPRQLRSPMAAKAGVALTPKENARPSMHTDTGRTPSRSLII